MKKALIISLLISCVIFSLAGCGGSQLEESEATSSSADNSEDSGTAELSREQYTEIYSKALVSSPSLSDPNNYLTYDIAQSIAPNDKLIDFSVGYDSYDTKNYFMNIYDYDGMKVAIIYDEDRRDNTPYMFTGMVFFSNIISSRKLTDAETLEDVYEITGTRNNNEFSRYLISADFTKSFFYRPSYEYENVEGFRTIIFTDDGFYLVKFEDDMVREEGNMKKMSIDDRPAFNFDCKIEFIEKCELPEQEKLYEIIRENI